MTDDKSQRLRFGEVIELLQKDALALKSNSAGFIDVRVRGIDVSSPEKKKTAQRRGGKSRRKGSR
jgi:hypothetical protein